MSCKFDAGKWVLVVDSKHDSENTANSVKAVEAHGLSPKMVIDCDKNDAAKPCTTLPKLPAWCHSEAGMCWFGSRTECEHFEDLHALQAKQAHDETHAK